MRGQRADIVKNIPAGSARALVLERTRVALMVHARGYIARYYTLVLMGIVTYCHYHGANPKDTRASFGVIMELPMFDSIV